MVCHKFIDLIGMKFGRLTVVKMVGKKGTTLNAISYDYCVDDFNKWFCDNLNQLWW